MSGSTYNSVPSPSHHVHLTRRCLIEELFHRPLDRSVDDVELIHHSLDKFIRRTIAVGIPSTGECQEQTLSRTDLPRRITLEDRIYP